MVLFGQRIFATFPLNINIDREKGTFVLGVGGGIPYGSSVFHVMVVIIVTLVLVVALFGISFWLLLIRQRRLMAEKWLEENSNRLIDFVLQKKDESGEVEPKSSRLMNALKKSFPKKSTYSVDATNVFDEMEEEDEGAPSGNNKLMMMLKKSNKDLKAERNNHLTFAAGDAELLH